VYFLSETFRLPVFQMKQSIMRGGHQIRTYLLLLFLIHFVFRVLFHQQLFSKGLEMLLKEGTEGPNDME
jgi:hypothetical protein